ncbi:HEAT repeat domain-containing protein [Anthocerotibacter panamensis]|uniref:HEAT repeat domain-containing protein n=1 Tax=Anthocerotibacter panamensis TaxID=2857077 RepID=UPI001FD944C5|nr:HEAT repeat domain-containing protein [Anthocerotibacter panamensis]
MEEAERALVEPGVKIPILVELRLLGTATIERIRDVLNRYGCFPAVTELERWVGEGQFLLLLDGVNELSSDAERREVRAFRERFSRVPMVFTTRDLGVGGDLGIQKKLEMQSLSEPQIKNFVMAYLPEQGEAMLRRLQGRLREFGQTPFLLWMLCEIFKKTQEIPQNLGSVFQSFTKLYDTKEGFPEETRRWCLNLLQVLAFAMMRGETAVDLRVAISEQVAENILTEYLQGEQQTSPRNCAKHWLQDLIKFHLLRLKPGGGRPNEIEFLHQLIQEYYAANELLRLLPTLGNDELKRKYLNYLKWTEPLVLMLGITPEKQQALRVVQAGLEVDLKLGARLVGAVRTEFQKEAIDLLIAREMPKIVLINLFGETRSSEAVLILNKALQDKDSLVRSRAAYALGQIGSEQAVEPLLRALQDENAEVRGSAAYALGRLGSEQAVEPLLRALQDENAEVRGSAADALGQIGSEQAVEGLLRVLQHEDADVRGSAADALGQIGSEQAVEPLLRALQDEDADVRWRAAYALGRLGSEQAVELLLRALQDENADVRWRAAYVLGQIGSEQAVEPLLRALQDENAEVRLSAADALGQFGSEQAVEPLLRALQDENAEVRLSAADALGQIGSEQAVEPLLRALQDEDAEVRWSAADALEKIGNPKLLPELWSLFLNQGKTELLSAISAIQERCKFYNYELTVSKEKESPPMKPTTQKTILRVVVASPGDVQAERDFLPKVLEELNRSTAADRNLILELYRWEIDSYPGFHTDGPQGLIDPILCIENSNIFIGILWKRFGKPTKDGTTGTEHEFNTAYEAWKKNQSPHIMFYFNQKSYTPNSIEELEQHKQVFQFRESFPEEGLRWKYTGTDEFESLVRQHLTNFLRDRYPLRDSPAP